MFPGEIQNVGHYLESQNSLEPGHLRDLPQHQPVRIRDTYSNELAFHLSFIAAEQENQVSLHINLMWDSFRATLLTIKYNIVCF